MNRKIAWIAAVALAVASPLAPTPLSAAPASQGYSDSAMDAFAKNHKPQGNKQRNVHQPRQNLHQPKISKQHNVGQPRNFKQVNPTIRQGLVSPQGGVTAKKFTPIRDARRASISGRNFMLHRGGNYRVRYGGGWRTFVALGALSALAVGGVSYYPYAYIDAPGAYCRGFTEDGCQLEWRAVPTIDGTAVLQCVAYCPWQ
jgi:hypothetical protein